MSEVEKMSVSALTGDPVVMVAPDASLPEVADVLVEHQISSVVVGTNDDVKGIVSERDVVAAVAGRRDPATVTASDVATIDVVWVNSTATVAETAAEMMERWIRHVLVETNGRLVGMISARDLLGAYASAFGADEDED